jgi:hypothetical protein
MSESEIPSNFQTILFDMTTDLSNTFPEYSYLWNKWTKKDVSEDEIKSVYQYCLKVYPERFFDILYQKMDLFDLKKETNTLFLPGVEFKLLFHCPGISEKTQKIMWKYLQLILFTIVGSIQDKSIFGDAMNMFTNLDESEFQNKLSDAMQGMSEFFQNLSGPDSENAEDVDEADETEFAETFQEMSKEFEKFMNGEEGEEGEEEENEEGSKKTGSGTKDDPMRPSFTFDKTDHIPNASDLHGHIKSLFDGKIGHLAKELAEEISQDMSDLLGKDTGSMKSTGDVLRSMMKEPGKMTGLIKTVTDKIQQKMNSGEISQEELMQEATGIIGKMGGLAGSGGGGAGGLGGLAAGLAGLAGAGGLGEAGGGADGMPDIQSMMKEMLGSGGDIQTMFRDMAKNMGVNIPKNARVDTNAVNRMSKESTQRERMKQRIMMKKAKEAELAIANQAAMLKSAAEYVPYDFSLEEKEKPNQFVFKIPGEESQPHSSIANFSVGTKPPAAEGASSNKKKKNKKKK